MLLALGQTAQTMLDSDKAAEDEYRDGMVKQPLLLAVMNEICVSSPILPPSPHRNANGATHPPITVILTGASLGVVALERSLVYTSEGLPSVHTYTITGLY